MSRKVFVDVLARQDKEGQLTPLAITWEDGRVFEIDSIMEVCMAACMSVGGCGIRYTCRIHGKDKHLFLDNDKWFMEAKR